MQELRPFQRTAIDILRKQVHLICVAPTGSGKSLIYERIAAQRGFRTVLVSPLVALARQQARRLAQLGIPHELGAGDSSAGPPRGQSGTWIISPEKVWGPHSQKAAALLREWRPNFLAVDECHCLWEWGDGFRPAFFRVPEMIQEFKIERSVWLTATLPHDARIYLRHRIQGKVRELGVFDLPPRLHLEVRQVPWVQRAEMLLSWIRNQEGAGIIFVSTRENTLRVSRLLAGAGISSLIYHAGMSAEERRATESLIAVQAPRVIVATSAFGMGMDHSHLRWSALWQAPQSLLALAQAIGRVGRGGAEGNALVLWDGDDFKLLEWAVRSNERKKKDLLETYKFLSSQQCRRRSLASYFSGQPYKGGEKNDAMSCHLCDFCNK